MQVVLRNFSLPAHVQLTQVLRQEARQPRRADTQRRGRERARPKRRHTDGVFYGDVPTCDLHLTVALRRQLFIFSMTLRLSLWDPPLVGTGDGSSGKQGIGRSSGSGEAWKADHAMGGLGKVWGEGLGVGGWVGWRERCVHPHRMLVFEPRCSQCLYVPVYPLTYCHPHRHRHRRHPHPHRRRHYCRRRRYN